jgi:pilus assembly protein FimV
LQKLLDVKNKDLAAKEAELTAKSAKKDGKEVKEPEKPVAQTAPVVASGAATASAPAAVAASAVASAPVASASASASEKPRRRPVAPPPPPPEPSFFESLSDWAMPAGAGLIAILAGVGLWANQRRKKQQQFEDSILTGSSMKANSMFGSTGGRVLIQIIVSLIQILHRQPASWMRMKWILLLRQMFTSLTDVIHRQRKS